MSDPAALFDRPRADTHRARPRRAKGSGTGDQRSGSESETEARRPAPDDSPIIVSSQRELAAALGVNPSNVSRWRTKAEKGETPEPFPIEEDGSFVVDKVRAWRQRNIDRERTPAGHIAGEPVAIEKQIPRTATHNGDAQNGVEPRALSESQLIQLEMKREDLRKKRMDNDIREGKVVAVDEVTRALVARAHTLTRAIERATERAVASIPDPHRSTVRLRLNEEIAKALEDYAKSERLTEAA